MILNQSRPPKVRMPDGTVKSLAQCGLPQLLATAAQAEGYTHWWVAEDILVGVRTYLVSHRGGEVIESHDLESTLLTALVGIGHPEIARRIRSSKRHARICLQELAQKADGHELLFFSLLKDAVDELCKSPTASPEAHFAKVRAAVQILLGAHRWSPACDNLQDQIIDQIHTRVQASGRSFRLALTLR